MSSNPALTIYFRGFAEDTPNEELESLFESYGTIVKCFIHKSRTYGMVEFDDLSSCITAIGALNGTPPLNLYLNFAKSQSAEKSNTNMNEPKRTSGNKFNNHYIDSVTYFEQEAFVDENNSLINVLQDPSTNEIYVPIRYAQNIRRIVKKIAVPIDIGLHRNENLSDNDDCVSVHSHTSRKVNLNNVHDIRIERSFTEVDQNIRKSPNQKSQRNGFNKNEDSKPVFANRFIKDNRFKDNFNKNDDSKPFNHHSKPGSSQSSGTSDEAKPKFNKKFQEGSGENQTQKFHKKEFGKAKAPEGGEGDWGACSSIVEEKDVSKISSTSVIKKFPFNNIKPKTNKVLYKTIELPKNQFTQVQIEHTVSETVGWAQISALYDEFVSFMLAVIEKKGSKTKPEVGKLCLAEFDDILFRAVVLTTFPKITVRFIDYGNESVVEGDILEMSPEHRDVPAYALCIKLANGAPCKLKNNLKIKITPIKVNNDVVVVHVENGIYGRDPEPETPVQSTSASAVKPPAHNSSTLSISSTSSLTSCQESMMSKLEVNKTGIFEATIKLSSTNTVGFFMPEDLSKDVAALDEISTIVENINFPSFRPKVGDLVAAHNDGWHRAFVLKVENGFKVAFIDYGTIKRVQDVKPLPDEFRSIPQFSCVCTSSESDLTKINANNNGLSFEITKILNNIIHCKLSTASSAALCEMTFVLWNPKDRSKFSGTLSKMFSASNLEAAKKVKPQVEKKLTPPELKLKNGDDVKVIDESKGYLFVRTKEAMEILKRVDKYISEYAPKAQKIPQKPVVGQYVAAQFENVWYRAKVTNVNQSNADILYIDYGNEELKPFFSLKLLDEQICEEPCTLIKIKLKGFVDKPFTQKCLAFFGNLAETNQILKATFQGSEDNGVDLTMKDGKNVTEELIKLDLVPKSKPFKTRKELYTRVKVPGATDPKILKIELVDIPFGKGEVRYLCDVNLKDNLICVCVNQPDMLHKVHVELLNQMTKYVNQIAPKTPYKPVREEIVLAENKDKWYRAICLEPENEEKFIVFFIDYGFNLTVTPDKLRQMPQEFVEEFKALGNFATIHGLSLKLDDTVIDRIETLLLKNEVYKCDVLDKDTEDYYTIKFPELLQQLRSENLI